MTKKTVVTRVPVESNSSRIAQGILSGALLQAGRLQYDYMNDKDIPENFDPHNFQAMDVVEKLEYARILNEKVQEYIRTPRDSVESSQTTVEAPTVDSTSETDVSIDNPEKSV